jgi:hypothetical protein
MLSQRKKEIETGHFLEPFDVLLPGMNIIPVHVVPKPPDDKLHLVVNHSTGPFFINSLIDCQSIAGVKLDGIKTLGDSIRAFRASHPADSEEQSLILWKLDVAAADKQHLTLCTYSAHSNQSDYLGPPPDTILGYSHAYSAT